MKCFVKNLEPRARCCIDAVVAADPKLPTLEPTNALFPSIRNADGTKADDVLDAAAYRMLLLHLIRATMFTDDNSSTQNLPCPGFSITNQRGENKI